MTDLVTLQHPGGVARVHRDADGQVWLSGMDAFGGTLIDGRFTVAGIVDGLVAGGLLPSGATRAVLEGAPTHVGGGAWLGRIDDRFDTPAVRFEDDAGNVVRPPLPSAWPVEPVPDADAPCPACGATTWERVTATDDSRGMHSTAEGGLAPTPVVVCTRCGHEEGEGVWYSEPDPEYDAAAAQRALIARLTLPVHVVRDADLPPALCGWGDADGELDSVTICHGEGLRVETEREAFEPDDEAVREALFAVLQQAPPDASPAAHAVWSAARDRRCAAAADDAVPFETQIDVDGAPIGFRGIRHGDAWAALGVAGAYRIMLAARELAPERIALEAVDPRELPEP